MSEVIVRNKLSFLDADLEDIKKKIMQESKKGVIDWSLEKCNKIEILYKKWMICAEEHRDIPFVPNKDIDIFWHFHILHTKKYMADCEKYFGRYIHHNPHLVNTDEMKANRRKSKEIFLKKLGINEDEIRWEACFWEPDPDEEDECSKCD